VSTFSLQAINSTDDLQYIMNPTFETIFTWVMSTKFTQVLGGLSPWTNKEEKKLSKCLVYKLQFCISDMKYSANLQPLSPRSNTDSQNHLYFNSSITGHLVNTPCLWFTSYSIVLRALHYITLATICHSDYRLYILFSIYIAGFATAIKYMQETQTV